MTIQNPYESPQHVAPTPVGRDQALLRGGGTVFLSTLAGGAFGLTIGLSLGYFLPDYYRSVIVGGDSPSFDPLVVGFGLGLSQGCMAGAACGVALAGLQFWFRAREDRREEKLSRPAQ